MRKMLDPDLHSPGALDAVFELANTGIDLLIYGHLRYTFTFDFHTRKVTYMECVSGYSSVGAAPHSGD